MGIVALIACAGAFLWVARRVGLPWREAVLAAAVLWGAILALVTETLSSFHAITLGWLILSWFAVAAIALAIGARLRSSDHIPVEAKFSLGRARSVDAWMLCVAVLLVVLMAVIGTLSAPSNIDSMTYHLPRVMHWMQGRSVAHYPAAHEPQLYQPPWAEFAILHFQVLTGGDRFAFTVQWVSMLICAVGAALLAGRIGAGPRGQTMAILFLVTVPGVVLQGYSTQNNLSVGAWLICAVVAILVFRESVITRFSARALAAALMFGLSVGLAMLTKGTGYVFALPLLVWFVGVAIRRAGIAGLKAAAVAAVAAAALNLGQWSRNWRSYGSILLPADQVFLYRARVRTPGQLTSNVIRNVALNSRTGIAAVDRPIYRAAGMLQRAIGADEADPAVTFPGHSLEAVRGMGEDVPGNPLHLVLLLAASGAVLWGAARGRPKDAAMLVGVVAVGFLLFSLTVKWQMFHARLLVPLFVLAAPFVGLALEQTANRAVANLSLAIALALAFALIVVNPSHPLVGGRSIFRVSREAQYFANRRGLYQPMRQAADLLAGRNCSQIGITTGPVWEYPLWVMLHARTGRWPRIVPVRSAQDVSGQVCAVLALPPGPVQEGSLPAGVEGTIIPLGGGVTIAIKPETPVLGLRSTR
jgi:hypothetical protein